tara:strand:- start:12 stop:143 length:132 start_codon:yes stop_codon:yes gene_type:complete
VEQADKEHEVTIHLQVMQKQVQELQIAAVAAAVQQVVTDPLIL